MKVAKEQIVGMVAAVDWFLASRTRASRRSSGGAPKDLGELERHPGVETEISIPPVANHVPHLLIRYSQEKVKISPREVMTELRKGSPASN